MDAPTKEQWRRRAEAARAGADTDHTPHLLALAEFLEELRAEGGADAGYVVSYHAMGHEVDLSPLMGRSELGPFAVTRTPEAGSELTIHRHGSELERHPYGFDQPIATAPRVDDADIAVVLVPGLAFDRSGGRLGHGAGYYDHLLSRLLAQHHPAPTEPLVFVGITGGYVVAELPTERHDVAMTHLCGEFGVLPAPLADPIG